VKTTATAPGFGGVGRIIDDALRAAGLLK